MTNIRLISGFVAIVFAVTSKADDQAKPRPDDDASLPEAGEHHAKEFVIPPW